MGSRPSEALQSGDDAETALKLCTKCEQLLPVSNFCKATKAFDGLFWKCRACQKRYADSTREARNIQKAIWYRDVDRWKRIKKRALKREPYASKYNPLALDLREQG
jgi:hypothetical protein